MSPRLEISTGQPWEAAADVLVIPLVGDPELTGPLAELDRRSGGEIRALLEFGEAKGKRYQAAIAAPGELPFRRLLVIGAGDAASLDRETVRYVAAAAERRLGGREVRTLAFWLGGLPDALGGELAATVHHVVRGLIEGSYEPRAIYRGEVPGAPPALEAVTIVASPPVATIVEGANVTRNLANRAANDLTPEALADEATTIAKANGLHVDVIGPEKATAMGMGMFMAVGRGSDNPPRMIVMRSGRAGETDARGRHLAIVGKGVCFDSGGISIKPADRMEEMKMDNTGACTVIAAIATVAKLAPGTPLLALAPAVENMPGPHSTRPGDVVRAMNGKTVDITNTDAEGRLILGDALVYAEQLGATHLVDVATLTGAVGRALGHMVAGAFGEPQPFVDEVLAAGRAAGERYAQLPLVDDYRSDMDSWYADFQNAGAPEGGLVKSALFLREFVTKPWTHLDIASTAYYRKAVPFAPTGATGASHATLVELALAGAARR